MTETFFQATNTLALLAWIALVLFPGKELVSGRICALVVPGSLALSYACVIGWKLATNGPPPGDVMLVVPGCLRPTRGAATWPRSPARRLWLSDA